MWEAANENLPKKKKKQSVITACTPPTLNRRRELISIPLTLRVLVEEYLYLISEYLVLDLSDKEADIYEQIYTLTSCALDAHIAEAEDRESHTDKRSQYEAVRARLIDPFLASM